MDVIRKAGYSTVKHGRSVGECAIVRCIMDGHGEFGTAGYSKVQYGQTVGECAIVRYNMDGQWEIVL